MQVFPFNSSNANYSPNFYYTLNFNLNNNLLYNIDKKLNLGFLLGFSKTTYTMNSSNQYIYNSGEPDSITLSVIIYYAYCEGEMTYGSIIADYLYLYVDEILQEE